VAGKLLGAMIGLGVGLLAQSWLAAGLFCAVGAFAGHLYDQLHHSDVQPHIPSVAELGVADPGPLPAPQSQAELQADARRRFAEHLCVLFAAVAKADGAPARDEVRVIREYFEETLRFTPAELEAVRVALKAALAAIPSPDEALRACRDELSAPDRLLLLSALYDLALADGDLRRNERDVIQRIADGLEISTAEQRSVRALHFPDAHAEYARLGLDAAATDDEVKAAFRQLAIAHHPDRVAHLGDGAMEVAARRFRELKDAYDAIRRLRGL
jgi:DnaJ like chaperone protein